MPRPASKHPTSTPSFLAACWVRLTSILFNLVQPLWQHLCALALTLKPASRSVMWMTHPQHVIGFPHISLCCCTDITLYVALTYMHLSDFGKCLCRASTSALDRSPCQMQCRCCDLIDACVLSADTLGACSYGTQTWSPISCLASEADHSSC